MFMRFFFVSSLSNANEAKSYAGRLEVIIEKHQKGTFLFHN